jgi:hypothetical protein
MCLKIQNCFTHRIYINRLSFVDGTSELSTKHRKDTALEIMERRNMLWPIFKREQRRVSHVRLNKGNNKITELRTILQRESQNS